MDIPPQKYPHQVELVKSVAVDSVVLVTSTTNIVWRFDHSISGSGGNFVRMGRANNFNIFPVVPVTLSKPFTQTCYHGRKVLMAFIQSRHRLYSMEIRSNYGYIRSTPGFQSAHGYYTFTNTPAVLPNSKCPKAFTVLSQGEMLEYFR